MRRLMSFAACTLFLAVPLWAQHGAGHAGGGHGGGFAGHGGVSASHGGGFGGHAGFSGGHAFSGMRSGSGGSRGFTHIRSPRAGFSRGPFLHDRFRGQRIRPFGFRNNCFGFRCRSRIFYPYAYGGYYDPYWWWDSGSSYDDDYERDRAIANDMNAQSLDQQRMLRQEEADGDQDAYAHSAPAPRDQKPEGAAIMPATVLVFRDRHKQEVQNYAIVGQTLWTFAPQRTEKIPLADLDLAATTKANDDRGVGFHVPSSSEAQ